MTENRQLTPQENALIQDLRQVLNSWGIAGDEIDPLFLLPGAFERYELPADYYLIRYVFNTEIGGGWVWSLRKHTESIAFVTVNKSLTAEKPIVHCKFHMPAVWKEWNPC